MRDRGAAGNEWWRLMPQGASADALRVLAARAVRAFADSFVALLLPIYLLELGFSAFAIGVIVCGTLIGTALLTLWVGMIANRHSRRRLLLAASLLMAATGVGFAGTTAFWPLLLIAFVGTINPTSGDASVFLPLEQTVLTETVEPRRRSWTPWPFRIESSIATRATSSLSFRSSLTQHGRGRVLWPCLSEKTHSHPSNCRRPAVRPV